MKLPRVTGQEVLSAPPNFLPYGHQWIDEDDIAAVVEVLRSDYLTTGPKVREFEEALAAYVGAQYAVAVSSGTAALHAAAFAAGFGPGDEVITTPITFVATANCIFYRGATPVFADIDPRTYNLDPEQVAKKITPRTKAVIPVHFAGQPCDLDAIHELARRHKLVVIEDAAHALGAEYKGRRIGGLSDLTIFSFHPVKHITTGEGGMVSTNSQELYERLLMFRNHGLTRDPAMWTAQEENRGLTGDRRGKTNGNSPAVGSGHDGHVARGGPGLSSSLAGRLVRTDVVGGPEAVPYSGREVPGPRELLNPALPASPSEPGARGGASPDPNALPTAGGVTGRARNALPWYYEVQLLGYNYRLSDIHAALGASQLKKADRFLARRREIAQTYNKAFAGLPGLITPYQATWAASSWHIYVLQVDARPAGISRDELFDRLRDQGIGANLHYIPVYRHPLYQVLAIDPADYPAAEAYYRRAITLPLFPAMTQADVERVIEAIRLAVLGGNKNSSTKGESVSSSADA